MTILTGWSSKFGTILDNVSDLCLSVFADKINILPTHEPSKVKDFATMFL